MNMFLALVAFVVIRVIRGVVCLTYLFRGGSPEAEPALPSAPGTQLMPRTNYEAVADFAGHWLHRAQVSLLTGKIGQIKLSHIRKKNPGAGLVRAWCGPGAGLVRARSLVRAWRGCCVKHTNPELQGNFSERTEWYSTALAAGIEPRAE